MLFTAARQRILQECLRHFVSAPSLPPSLARGCVPAPTAFRRPLTGLYAWGRHMLESTLMSLHAKTRDPGSADYWSTDRGPARKRIGKCDGISLLPAGL